MKNNLLKLLKITAVTALCIACFTALSFFKCPIHSVTGLYCPGCGATRMVLRLMHLDLDGAFHENACIVILFIPIMVYIITQAVYYIKHGRFLRNTLINAVEIIFISLFIIFGILRNFPGFEFLQPI